MTRILLVDDHALVRSGIRALLERLPGVEIVGEASDGRQGIEMAGKLRPDVVLMDIQMPEMNGLDCTEHMVRLSPGIRVIMLSMVANEEYVAQALRAGASGYLLKDSDRAELSLAINAVRRGEKYLSPAAASSAARLAMRGQPEGPVLTMRQREVLHLIALGSSTKEIAAKLHLSPKTVETHRSDLMDRLAIHDVAGLVRYAIRTGLVSPDV